ncbi:relaxin-3 receptor 1-like [Alosa pseudoharengus]|uniref:relaxin-3 receptor 1-like n=1 Tax=Alosa pseudoharengus TaxID=34774 RepID=UPI003F8BA164
MKAPAVTLTERMEEILNLTGNGPYNKTLSDHEFNSLESIDDTSILRIIISVVYSVVCAVGLVGNLLVFFLMKLRQKGKKSSINFFVLNLAVTDFQCVLTLPFWAVHIALNFSWPFGVKLCKAIVSINVMNMYASVFFLTAMSITCCWSVTSTLRNRTWHRKFSVKWVSAGLWILAIVATAPAAIFATVKTVAGENMCVLTFPNGQSWLALYLLQHVLIAFVLPMLILSICCLMLLRFICQRRVNNHHTASRSRVTKSVTIVVLLFFLCWMPNHSIRFWGVLVKLNVANFNRAYYIVVTYVSPVTICLASNSCLIPILYCLMQREFRQMLKNLFWCKSSPVVASTCELRTYTTMATKPEKEDVHQGVIPLIVLETEKLATFCH